MDSKVIFLAAVRVKGFTWPFVSEPVGPIMPDDTDALERGRAALEEMHGTTDIRTARTLYGPREARVAILWAILQDYEEHYGFMPLVPVEVPSECAA